MDKNEAVGEASDTKTKSIKKPTYRVGGEYYWVGLVKQQKFVRKIRIRNRDGGKTNEVQNQ